MTEPKHSAEVADQGDEAWPRAGLDALRHARAHLERATEPDARQALVSLDHAIEALVTGFLRSGPGVADDSQMAIDARRPGAKFWAKGTYIVAVAARQGRTDGFTADDYALVRSIRNAIQHSGEWLVPAWEDLSRAVSMTAMTCELLGCDAIAGPLLVEPRRPSGDDGDTGGDLVPVPSHPLVGRKLAEEAWPIAREIDPEQDGLHVRVLGDRLAQRGLMPDRAQALYDALNHAHDLFRARGKAVWTWMEPGAKAVDGLSSRALADVAVAVLLVHDPDRTGIHAGRQILPILDRWRVPVRGQDRAATLVAAINGDKRFERVAVEVDGRVRTRSGTYRLL